MLDAGPCGRSGLEPPCRDRLPAHLADPVRPLLEPSDGRGGVCELVADGEDECGELGAFVSDRLAFRVVLVVDVGVRGRGDHRLQVRLQALEARGQVGVLTAQNVRDDVMVQAITVSGVWDISGHGSRILHLGDRPGRCERPCLTSPFGGGQK